MMKRNNKYFCDTCCVNSSESTMTSSKSASSTSTSRVMSSSSSSSHREKCGHKSNCIKFDSIIRCYCYTIFLLSIIFFIDSMSLGVNATSIDSNKSTQSSVAPTTINSNSNSNSNNHNSNENIKWPKAVDSIDEQLIKLAKSAHSASRININFDDINSNNFNYNRIKRNADPDADPDADGDVPSSNSPSSSGSGDDPLGSLFSSSDDSTGSSTSKLSNSTGDGKNGTVKNYTIDWNEVEKHWDATLSEEEVAKKFAEMENGAKNGVRSLLRSLFPRIVAMSSDAKVSGNCSAGILKWIISLRHLKGWAIRMLDAIGKPPGGILEGAITMFGNHKQCLDVRAPDDEDDFEDEVEEGVDSMGAKKKIKEFFRGQYCALEIKPWLPPKPRFYGFSTKIESLKRDPSDDSLFGELSELAIFMHLVPLRFDLCVPSLCTREDLQRVSSFLGSKLDLKVKVSRCEVYSDSFIPLSPIQVLALLGFLGAIGLVSLCTTLMVLLPIVRKGHGVPLLVRCLSLQSAWKEWTGLESYNKKPRIATLYGLRWILLMWIILSETINLINYNFFRDVLRLKDIIISQGAQVITNSSLQYSSLIFLSAFIFGYTNDGKGAWKGAKFVVKKYFRIIPVVISGVGIMMLLPLLDTPWIKGPTWADYVTNRTDTCQYYWYRSIFFLQNFYHPANVCLPHTWVLCVELQLAVVFTAVIGFVAKLRSRGKEAAGWIVLGFVALIGFAINFVQVYYHQLPPTWLWTLPDKDQRYEYFFLHLYKPWTHLSVYAIGVASGLLCHDHKKKGSSSSSSGGNNNNNNNNLPSVNASSPYGSCVIQLLGWTFVTVVTSLLIFYPHQWVLGNLPEPLFSGFYDGFHRIAWAITHVVLMHFIAKDIQAEFSIIHFVLGNKIFLAFGRLSLAAFVVHPIILLLFFATQMTHLFSGILVMLYFVIGTIALTYGLAFLIMMWVEYPTSAVFNSRDSTVVEKDPRLLPQPARANAASDFSQFKSSIGKFNSGTNTYHVASAPNVDIEMSKKQQEHKQQSIKQETAQIRL